MSPSFFMAAILNSLSFSSESCRTLSLVSGEFSFSSCVTTLLLPWSFMVLDDLC